MFRASHSSDRPRSSRALRLGLVRSARAESHLVTFVVGAVTTVLVTRGFLALTGYPQVGGAGLHIAHMLPGGLLMLVALFLLLSYVGPVIRPLAALLGGIGFGLFIDEVGKFVTSDNDYFYRPAPSIMYVVLVLVILAVRQLHRHRLDPREHLANAVDQAVEGVAGGLSPRRREEALRQLDAAGAGTPGAAEVATVLDRCEEDHLELPAWSDHAQARVLGLFDRLIARRWTDAVIVALLLVQGLTGLAVAALPAMADRTESWTDVSRLGMVVGCLVALGFTAHGLVHGRLRGRDGRTTEVRSYQLAVLSMLLVTRVFEFATNQVGAIAGLLLDLVLLGLVAAELARLRRAG
ncbi:MAG TPA: hypothetical protein VI076_01605 [Actinopolymorphaceae bacterium]